MTTMKLSQKRNAYFVALRKLFTRSIVYVILCAGLIFTLLPFMWMVMTSFKPSSEILRTPPTFFPEKFTLESYRTILTDPTVPLARFYSNSLFVSLSRVGITLFTSSLAGYVFSKFRFPGKNVYFALVLATLMIPFQVIMIPLYLILVRLHLINTLWGLVVPGMVDAFGIFLMRQFIESIPGELLEAARIDGASEFHIYWRIVVPQLGAVMAALGIFTFMATWNDYLWPFIVITDHQKRTLPLILIWYNSQHGRRYDLGMAAGMLVLIPILIMYFLFQRWIVKGITMTGFK
jgi:multiple sugar transport system permease protein